MTKKVAPDPELSETHLHLHLLPYYFRLHLMLTRPLQLLRG
jgi:hypothetical protein